MMTPLANGQAKALSLLPALDFDVFRDVAIDSLLSGHRAVAFFGAEMEPRSVDLFLVLANDDENTLGALRTRLESDTFPSLTPDAPQLHLFEREIAEQFGLRPEGHPWFKPVRYRPSWHPARDAWQRPKTSPIEPAVCDFYRVEGEDVHEVAVGPVHAGIIEPGHFRFQCHGEIVFHLEIALGFQHRGIEESLLGPAPNPRAPYLAETIAGDTTIGHATAYSQAIEALAAAKVPGRAQSLRAILLELERLANHVGDLGALANDVAFLPTASYNGRIRGDFLNMTALLCGSRFGRGIVRPGGVLFDLEPARAADLLQRLETGLADTANAVNLLFDSPSVLARFENKGIVPPDVCRRLGIVGLPARAAGIPQDIRTAHPAGIYRFAQIPISTWDTGDVFARAYVRWLEIQHSIQFIREQTKALPGGNTIAPLGPLKPDHFVVSLVEGWRGEIAHVSLTDPQGRIRRHKIVDPSFHNWPALAYALRGQQISDFPLCNKSFNLSYCGHDL